MFFVEKFSAGFSKLNFKCTQEPFEDFFPKSHVLKPVADNERNLQHSVKEFLAELSKLHSNFTWDYTAGNHFFDRRFFASFSIAEQKKTVFCEKVLIKFNKTAFYVSTESVWREIFFPKKSRILNVLRP